MTRPLPDDLAALRAGGKRALAATLSALETDAAAPRLAALLDAALAEGTGVALGLTGPPGVGKSTLVNALIARVRARGQTVGVIAVDPSSRRSGGALLGDRTRIETDPEDRGVFVRSMAARRRLGGLADITYPAMTLMRAVFDLVIVETVGVGQSETEIGDVADLVVFCAQPGSGDALQFMKAGVMEVPDVVLVTKGDLGLPARRAAADLRGALSLAAGNGPAPDVSIVSALDGTGVDAALDRIAARMAAAPDAPARRRAQGRAWAEARIADSFGSVGLAALGPRIAASPSPFQAVARLLEAGRRAVHDCLKEV
ncbi:ArgK/MeaB family GTPase [Amaricoccus sp.]|uniref:ArgK/MeaB family GTPase n=1 Tax=Amaricoccus sp. TaxID=1872485 RepID=UPI001B54DDB0|nr:ATP/GTP-binding protein [Amaricoccus sp.]MBP7240812.1 ATP/GTP-binding protein [Amaricoccus sp.]